MTNMTDATATVESLKNEMRTFVAERDWEQFHDLKNLSMAVAVEAGELMDHFRWVDNKAAAGVMEDAEQARAVRHEVADVLLLVLDFAIMAKIDLASAVAEKLELNRKKYPVEAARGSNRKRKA
jgi:NTP pyrophosphatase (non-canonical NTP hydrolase)